MTDEKWARSPDAILEVETRLSEFLSSAQKTVEAGESLMRAARKVPAFHPLAGAVPTALDALRTMIKLFGSVEDGSGLRAVKNDEQV